MQLDEKGERIMQLAQKGYEGYCAYTGWKSAVTGAKLPPWLELPGNIVNAWFAAAKAIVEEETRQ